MVGNFVPHLAHWYIPTFRCVKPRSPSFGSTMTENTRDGVSVDVPQLGQTGKFRPQYIVAYSVKSLCYSRIDSSSETADQRVTRANEGMLGSWATSSSMLIAFAALTAT